MSPQAPPRDPGAAGFAGQIPAVERLLSEIIGDLSLAAHAYMAGDDAEHPGDLASAEIAIDVAAATFERVKERLRPDDRLAITQVLTETRMSFVRKRGL